ATRPSATPTAIASRIERTPACIETRLPQTTRVNASRPRSSVPNGCAALGGLRIWLQSVAAGSVRAIHGAPRAVATNRSTIAPPSTETGRRRTRRQPRRSAPAGSVWPRAGATPVAAVALPDASLTADRQREYADPGWSTTHRRGD